MAEDKRYTRHARLVSRMADTLGLDLVEALQRGQVSPDDIRDLVHRCEGCTQPEKCAQLLAQGNASHTAPDYCRNADYFARLKR